jgi:LmbE family N-acetylglucosaminyl deacetylase
MNEPMNILCIGAHPDDCDLKLGGLAILWARLGHRVRFVSLCNGDAGHFRMGGGPLAQRRYQETQRSAAVAATGAKGTVEYLVMDTHDCQLMPTLEQRGLVIRLIREFHADLVITNRPNDYMADHRYASQLVQDAAYIVTVPNVEALTPHLNYNPTFAYWGDDFKRPYPFSPDVAVSIDEVLEQKFDMLHCHESQMYEWLPYNMNILDQVPQGDAERRAWLPRLWLGDMEREAERSREVLARLYGRERASRIRCAEALEFSEYGSPLSESAYARLFPFFA